MSHTFAPYYNIQNSVFGFAKNSNFLYFVLQSARHNAKLKTFWERPVPQQFGPTFFTSMFVSLNRIVLY